MLARDGAMRRGPDGIMDTPDARMSAARMNARCDAAGSQANAAPDDAGSLMASVGRLSQNLDAIRAERKAERRANAEAAGQAQAAAQFPTELNLNGSFARYRVKLNKV